MNQSGAGWKAPFVVAAAAFAFRFLTLGAIDNDHFVFVARARQVLYGDWPVRDFADPGMPLGYLLPAGAAAAAGPTLLADAVLWIGLFAAAVAVTFALVRRAAGGTAVALGGAALLLGAAPRLYNSSKVLVHVAAIALAWRYADRPTPGRNAALGAVTAAGFLLRHDYGVYIGAACVVLILVRHAAAPGQALRALASYAGVTLAAVAPWLAYVQWAAGIDEYFAAGLRFSAAEGQRTMGGWPPIYYAVAAVPAAALVIAARGAGDLRAAHVAFAATMLLAMDVVMLRDAPSARLPDVLAPTLVVGAILIRRFVPEKVIGRAGIGAAAALLVVVPVLLLVRGVPPPSPADLAARWTTVAGRLRRADPAITPDPARAPLIAYLSRCTAPGDRVLVVGFGPEIPVLANRPFAAGYPTVVPGYYEADEDVRLARARLAREPLGAAVVLGGARGFGAAWPDVLHDLRARGLAPHTVATGDAHVEVWVPRASEASPADPATGLPCR